MHGAGGDRSQMLHLATWMAARGAVALTIDSPLARLRSPIQQGMAGLRKIQDLTVVNVVDLRRAVDVLDALPEVDRRRIAYVGYSAGARAGAVLAGVEHRIKAYDLVSGGATPPRAYLAGIPKSRRGEVLRLLHKVDPLRYVRQAAPSALFFQDGRSDGVVPSSALVGLARAASKPKLVRWYPAGHNLDAVAFRDQLRWLSARLGLDGPVVHGVPAGP
jgi:dienelactone hydrolase